MHRVFLPPKHIPGLEPWCGLPSYPDMVDDISEKNDMFHIAKGEKKHLEYSVEFHWRFFVQNDEKRGSALA